MDDGKVKGGEGGCMRERKWMKGKRRERREELAVRGGEGEEDDV